MANYFRNQDFSDLRYQPANNSLRDQLERETQALIQERNSIQVHRPSTTNINPSQNRLDISGNSRQEWKNYGVDPNQSQSQKRKVAFKKDQQKKGQLKKKIGEIIELCQEENEGINGELNGVIGAERQILDILQQTDPENVRPRRNSNEPAPRDTSQTYTPITSTPIHDYQDRIGNQKAGQYDFHPNRGQANLSEDALRIIDEIQRKAIAEIEKLRAEKLALIRSLNQEISNVTFERKKNIQLERKLQERGYTGNASVPSNALDSRQEQQLRARAAFLENALSAEQQKSSYLSQQLENQNVPDLNVLYAQGQAIRKETLRLLKLKESKFDGNNSKITSNEKQNLLSEVLSLREKIELLQNENNKLKRSSKFSNDPLNNEYSPIQPSHNRANSFKNPGNEYESMISEMKKITGHI